MLNSLFIQSDMLNSLWNQCYLLSRTWTGYILSINLQQDVVQIEIIMDTLVLVLYVSAIKLLMANGFRKSGSEPKTTPMGLEFILFSLI